MATWYYKEGRWAEPRASWSQARDPGAKEKLILRLKARARWSRTTRAKVMGAWGRVHAVLNGVVRSLLFSEC